MSKKRTSELASEKRQAEQDAKALAMLTEQLQASTQRADNALDAGLAAVEDIRRLRQKQNDWASTQTLS